MCVTWLQNNCQKIPRYLKSAHANPQPCCLVSPLSLRVCSHASALLPWLRGNAPKTNQLSTVSWSSPSGRMVMTEVHRRDVAQDFLQSHSHASLLRSYIITRVKTRAPHNHILSKIEAVGATWNLVSLNLIQRSLRDKRSTLAIITICF